jgi:hypothetical protein
MTHAVLVMVVLAVMVVMVVMLVMLLMLVMLVMLPPSSAVVRAQVLMVHTVDAVVAQTVVAQAAADPSRTSIPSPLPPEGRYEAMRLKGSSVGVWGSWRVWRDYRTHAQRRRAEAMGCRQQQRAQASKQSHLLQGPTAEPVASVTATATSRSALVSMRRGDNLQAGRASPAGRAAGRTASCNRVLIGDPIYIKSKTHHLTNSPDRVF